MKNDFEEQVQRNLINHPARRDYGVDPLWKWIALMLLAIVIVLVYHIKNQ